MNSQPQDTTRARTAAEYIVEQLNAGILMGSAHFSVAHVQSSYDDVHVHAVLLIYTNHCGALLDALTRLAQLGITIDGMHQLGGKYQGSLEIDLLLNPVQRKRKPIKPVDPLPFDDYIDRQLGYSDEEIPF